MAFGDLKGTLTASVNSVTNPTNLSGSVAVSLDDLIFGTFGQQTNLTATGTVTDNLGNTYAYVNAGTDAGTVSIRCFWARVTVAGTLTQISVPTSASTNDASAVADVIEGPFTTSPLDANPANTTDATSPFTCPATGTLAQADEVVMAAIAVAANQTVAATSPSTLGGTVARANVSTGQSRRVVSSTSTVTPEFTGTSATSGQTTASFRKDTGIAVGSASGAGDAPATGASTASSEGSAPGTGSTTSTGAAIAISVGSSSGSGDATAPGLGLGIGTGSASGTGDASAVGSTADDGSSGSAQGSGTASAVGSSTAASTGTSAGTGDVQGIGSADGIAIGSSSGAGAASATGSSIASGSGNAGGSGQAGGPNVQEGSGSSAGIAHATAVGASTGEAIGSASASGTATASSVATFEGSGTSTGSSSATGVGSSTASAIGVSTGNGNAVATGVDGSVIITTPTKRTVIVGLSLREVMPDLFSRTVTVKRIRSL